MCGSGRVSRDAHYDVDNLGGARLAGGPHRAALPFAGYGFSVLSKMSVRFARLPSFAIAKNAANEFPARASPS
jgi:hypothetical protein